MAKDLRIELLAIAPADRQAYFIEGGKVYHARRMPTRDIVDETDAETAGIACAKHGYEQRREQFDDRSSLFDYLDRQMIDAHKASHT